jgi:hypothetical protein
VGISKEIVVIVYEEKKEMGFIYPVIFKTRGRNKRRGRGV